MKGAYEYGGWVLIGLAIYMVLMLFIGWWASKRVKNTTDFLVAGRRLGLFLCTGTLFATWFCSGTAMGGAGNAYIFGNQGVIFDPWGAGLCLFIAGMFFVRLMRRGKYLTLVDLFQIRYGKGVGLCSTFSLIVAEMGWTGAQLVAFGAIIHFFAGVPLWLGITISTVILVLYTYLGGMWAVTMTDAFQMIILTIGMIIMISIAVPLVGGLKEVFSNDPGGNWLGVNQWSFVPTPEHAADPELGNAGFLYYTGYRGWFYWLGAWMAIGLGSIPAQDLMQRVLSAKNERVATGASYIASFLYIVIGMMPVIVGMIYFKLNPDLSIEDALNKILLYMAAEHLPPFLTVIFVSALVAALMSSSDSAILATSSMIGYNAYKLFKPDVTEQQTLRATRIAVPIVTVVSLALALWLQVIYNLMVIAWSLLLVSLFAPYAAAYWWKKATRSGAFAAFFGGFAVWIITYFIHLPGTKEANMGIIEEGVVYMDWAIWDSVYISSVWGFIASVVLLIVVSLATQKSDPPLPLLDMDGNPLDRRYQLGIRFRKSGHL
ncbi:MAG: sodium:solute symporter family protein [Spirochaetales bacterium]|nr:sodium:solute symporter family protein [Spirochaetales bacterium]